MRGFGDRLSDEKIVAVIQYFKSLWPEKIRTHHAMLIQKTGQESQMNR